MTDSRRSRGLAPVAAATAAVFVSGQRVGSAVLADDRRLLTAGHVLRRVEAGAGAADSSIEVEFPFAIAGRAGTRVSARQARPVPAALDVGMLDLLLDAESAGRLPVAVPLWAARRLPARVSVFGFPREERALRGVWREFDTGGPVADGTVQLDWTGDAGTLPGHSGGPVVDPESGALVGVLVQGSQAGRFDRFLPISIIRQYWPDLPFPWLMTGTDARGHFSRRARGQGSSNSRGGDLFRGRAAALAAITSWLTDPDDRGRPLVVTGQPGAGKSTVLARAALDLEATRVGHGLAFHARGATHDDLLTALGDLTDAEQAGTRDELIKALDDHPPTEPVTIVVDALDEAVSGPDRREIAGTLAELATVPLVRVAVATRPLAVGHRYHAGNLLPALGITSAGSPALVDLDTDQYFDPIGLRQFAAAVLTQHQARHPNPAGAAWITYRADPMLCDRLAGVIADRADRNYLVAAMAAVPLSAAERPIDPAVDGFDLNRIPSGVGEALGKYLEQLPEPKQSRTRALLTALAYARGSGIDDHIWKAFTSALGYPITTEHLDQLRASTAADYLLQTTPDDAGPVTRLFHQALADELLARRHQPSDERALLSALRPAPNSAWATASSYALTYAADHASSARQLFGLVDDADYLVHADLARVAALLSLDPAAAADPLAVIVRQVAARANPLPPPRRARLLALAAAHFGLPELRRRFAATYPQPFTPAWAHSLGTSHMELTGHTNRVQAVAIGRAGDRDIIASADNARTVRVWDAATGQPIGSPLIGHTSWVEAVAIGRAGDRDILASAGWDGRVCMWDAATGQPIGDPLTGHVGTVYAVAIGRASGRDIIASGGGDDTVRVWDATTGQPIGDPLTGHIGTVNAVAIGRADGRDIIASASEDQTIRVWDAATRQPIGEPLAGHTGRLDGIAIGPVGGRDLIASAGQDGAVWLWDAATGQPIGEPLTGHIGTVYAVAIGHAGDRDIIASAGIDATVRLWDAATGEPIGEPLTGHTDEVLAVAVGHAGDRDIIASAGTDNTVRLWDIATDRSPGGSPTGHLGTVFALAMGRAGDRDIIASAGRDDTVRVWDAATGQPIGEPLIGDTGMVQAVAIGRAGDRDVIVSGTNETVRVWDAATGQPVGDPLTGHTNKVATVAIGRAGERDIIVSAGDDYTVRVWDAVTGQPVGDPLMGHTEMVASVVIGRVGGRDVIISAAWDHTVRVWDAVTGKPIRKLLTGGIGTVFAVAIGRVGGREVIVSACGDEGVLVWDATTGQPIGAPLTGHTDEVQGVAIGRVGNRDVIVSASMDDTVRIWDLSEGRWQVIDLLGAAIGVALAKDGQGICVSAGHTICLFSATG
ncbi:MAG: trypsin-like peptidase domain-containing protein [Trebonia sp.]